MAVWHDGCYAPMVLFIHLIKCVFTLTTSFVKMFSMFKNDPECPRKQKQIPEENIHSAHLGTRI